MFWTDGEWNHPDTLWRSPEILAWLYNTCENPEELVVNDRWGKGLRGQTRESLIRMLIDLVSKGGSLLLNIGPDDDGTIPVIMQDRLVALGDWHNYEVVELGEVRSGNAAEVEVKVTCSKIAREGLMNLRRLVLEPVQSHPGLARRCHCRR